MHPHPPTSALFPSTPLFRSGRGEKVEITPGDGRAHVAGEGGWSQVCRLLQDVAQEEPVGVVAEPAVVAGAGRAGRGERESTRLETRHLGKSHAVFFFEKKKS